MHESHKCTVSFYILPFRLVSQRYPVKNTFNNQSNKILALQFLQQIHLVEDIFKAGCMTVMRGERAVGSVHTHGCADEGASSQWADDNDDDAEPQSAMMHCCADMLKYAPVN